MHRANKQCRRFAMIAIMLLMPTMMGGCPNVRNEVADAFEQAIRGIIDVGLDGYFDQFRSNNGL